MIPYQIVDGTAVIVRTTDTGIQPVVVAKDHPHHTEILRRLIEGQHDDLFDLVDARANLLKVTRQLLNVVIDGDQLAVDVDGEVTFNGIPLEPCIAQAIRDRCKADGDLEDLVRFYRRLQRNSVPTIREQLFKFLNRGGFQLLPDGRFVSYKGVYKTDDPTIFASAHDRNFFYELGVKIFENVKPCDYDVGVACGAGLHVGTPTYASGYGDTTVEVFVDPAEVICVPNDSDGQKLRAKALFCHKVVERLATPTSTIYDGEVEWDDGEDEPSLLCVDEGPGEGSNDSTPKASRRTYYNTHTGASVRAEKSPGPGWSSTKPAPKSAAEAIQRVQKAVNTQSGARTYYNKKTGKTTRSLSHPGPDWTTHKPKEG